MNRILEGWKKEWVRILMGALVTGLFLLHVTGYIRLGLVDTLEERAYDARLIFTMPRTLDPRIVIIDIDEKSLAAEGRWPWNRKKMARLMDQLFDHYQVTLVGFDVVFPEPDESSGLKMLEELARTELRDDALFRQRLQKLRSELDYDAQFAASMKDRAVVLGYYFNEEGQESRTTNSGMLPPPTFVKGSFTGKPIRFLRASGYGANLAIFQQSARGGGHFNPWVDEDGIVRRVPLLYEYKEEQYESLASAITRLVLGARGLEPVYAPVPWGSRNYAGLENFRLGDRLIPVDERMRVLVPFRGRQGSFHYISATDVLHGTADPGLLRGTIALVGTTAPGLLDLRATPVQNAYPGVEIHANIISGILDQTLKEKPAYTLGAEFVTLVLLGLVISLALPLLSPLWATIVSGILLLLVVGTNLAFWQWGNLVLPVVSSLALVTLGYVTNMTYGYFIETRGKRRLAERFGEYIPPELVEEMAENPERYSMEAESRELTVLFSDVRGFTTISEGLNPQELSDLINAFLTPMTRIIHKHRGTIDKYMGDAIMAFWGAPLPDPEHARHALHAGLEMLHTLEELQGEFSERGWPEIRVGVGLNTGVMSVGNMGSEFRRAYTVMGDAVNLGSRLEGLTKSYGVSIIVSETTMAAVPEMLYRELDRVRVKGKDEPVVIYEPLGPAESVDKATRDELKLYQQALRYYRHQEWDMAELQFLNLQKKAPSRKLYAIYLDRIRHFRENPPGADWDGVFTHTTK